MGIFYFLPVIREWIPFIIVILCYALSGLKPLKYFYPGLCPGLVCYALSGLRNALKSLNEIYCNFFVLHPEKTIMYIQKFLFISLLRNIYIYIYIYMNGSLYESPYYKSFYKYLSSNIAHNSYIHKKEFPSLNRKTIIKIYLNFHELLSQQIMKFYTDSLSFSCS